ncbi:KfrB domain-containing protein [Nitrosomonas ureae]
MNGQKILQNFNDNEWKTAGLIKKAEEGIKPGIYNIYLAKMAETNNKAYEGLILLIDKQEGLVYQQANKDFISHKLDSFSSPPPIGKNVSIQYDNHEKLSLTKFEVPTKKQNLKI